MPLNIPDDRSRFLAAVGWQLILRHRNPVLFTPTFKLVQQLLIATSNCFWTVNSSDWITIQLSFWTF
jgi:hypothetical protein